MSGYERENRNVLRRCKVGAVHAVPLSVGGAGSSCNTMWPGPRPTSIPSGILIHPTVWPQYTNVTDRQTDRQTTVRQHRAFYKRLNPAIRCIVSKNRSKSNLKRLKLLKSDKIFKGTKNIENVTRVNNYPNSTRLGRVA